MWVILLHVLGVVSGIASIYGAVVSWQQSRRAKADRAGAEEQSRQAKAERAGAERAAARARELVRAINAQRLFAEAAFRCRRADVLIASGAPPDVAAARDQLVDVLTLVSRLSYDPAAGRLERAAAWRSLADDLHDLADTLNVQGRRPLGQEARRGVGATLVRIMTNLERLAARAAAGIGEDDARPE